MNPQKNGKNHFLVGQEMNGSIVVSCVETKSPSGNRWLKIHREFVLKNGSKFWLDKLVSREKGEETLADWLKEQSEAKAKKEAAQAKARDMAKLKMHAQNGASPSTKPLPIPPERAVKTKVEFPPKKHKLQPLGNKTTASKHLPSGGDHTAPPLPKSPQKQKPSSMRGGLSHNGFTDVDKRPKQPTSLRHTNFDDTDDIHVETRPMKPASLGKIHERRDPNVGTGKPSSARVVNLKEPDSPKRSEKSQDARTARLLAKAEAEEKARRAGEDRRRDEEKRLKAEKLARHEAEEKTRLETERLRIEEARREEEEKARREEEIRLLAKAEAEEKARREEDDRRRDEEKRLKAEKLARHEAEEKTRLETERLRIEEARREEEEKARREEEIRIAEQARREAEEILLREEEQRRIEEARREAEEKARREEEKRIAEQFRQDAEEKARCEEELRLTGVARQKASSRGENPGMKEVRSSLHDGEMETATEAVMVDEGDDETTGSSSSGASAHVEPPIENDYLPVHGTGNVIAQLPDDTPLIEGSARSPYDEVLADSSSRLGQNDSDGEAKKRRKKKRESKSSKSDETKRRKSKEKDFGESTSSNLDFEESTKSLKKKKKKKKESKKSKAGNNDLEQSQTDLNADSKATKKKAKKKKKDKDTPTSPLKEKKEEVVSNIHSFLEAMFEDTSERRSEGDESVGVDLDGSRNIGAPLASRDYDSDGSAEFYIDPSLLDHPLDNYSSDEPPSDNDDDFEYARVAGVNDFDGSALGLSQRPSVNRDPKRIIETQADIVDPESEIRDDLDENHDGLKEPINFSSLDEVKDSFPTFAKIMGVWVERENKLLYKTPLETVAKRSGTKKEVAVPTSPEAPSLGSMVRKWEAKFVKEEPERNDIAPRKLKNVWAEKLEFTKPFTKPSHKKSADEIKLIEDTVEKSFAFKDLTPDEMAPIVDAFERIEYEMGDTIGDQGEPENFYSIVQSGLVDFHSDGRKVGTAVPGDAFGELALLYSAPRPAEAKAAGHQTVLLQIDQTNFRHIMREQMIRSEEEKLKLLQSVEVFSNLDEPDLRQLGSAMVPHKFCKGDNLSSTFAEAPFCLVQQGSVTATDAQIGPGQYFGEESILSSKETKVEITATSDGLAFTIDRAGFEKVFGDFDRVLTKYQDKQTLASIRAIRAAKLEDDQLDTLVRQISEVKFKAGTQIFEFNAKMPPALYLVRSGKVTIVKKNGEERTVMPGEYFGEEYMFFTSKQSKDIVPDYVVVKYSAVALEEAVCGVLPLHEVGIVSGRIQAIQDIESTQNIALDDLERHRILGEGQFGVVWLVTVRNMEDDPYALKIQYIDDPCRDDPAACIREEIKMMRSIQHPFIIQVINTYEEEEAISMLLSLAPGGELFDILHRQDVNGWWVSGLAEPIAKFYSMVVADTLAFMHRQNYVYRDLKPENILIDKDGYPVLTDFGFVKKLEDGKTYTFCGTPNYVAPEVVLNIGHDTSADNWSLGVLIYELIDGANPFWEDGMDQQTLYELIAYGLHPPISRKKCSKAGRDLIGRLLEKDPSKRIGTFREKDILEHKWFRDFDIRELREKVIKAPWVPDKIRLEDDQ